MTGSEVWIYGERVKNIAEHPAFRNTARMVARLYDALHQRPCRGKECPDLPDRMGRLHPPLFRRAALGRGSGRRARRDRRMGAPDLGLARPLARLQGGACSQRSAAIPSSTIPTRRTRGAGTATARSGCRLSATRCSIRRSTATWRRARRAARPTSTPMSPARPMPESMSPAPRSSPPARR